MTTGLALVAAAGLAAVGYVYFGYPVVLLALARLRPLAIQRAATSPSVTVVVAAHDEEAVIGRKVANTLALDYDGHLSVVVASDGSTDRTVEVARRRADGRVTVLDLPRRGKAHALNDAVAAADGEILVFTDANTELRADAVARLVEPFADPRVGGVCGNQLYGAEGGEDSTEQGEGLYWRYDKWVKSLEGRSGSIFAGDGALHAVRRELYEPITQPAQADDMAISLSVVAQGRLLAWEPRAIAVEPPPAEGSREFDRKVRIVIHSLSAIAAAGPRPWRSAGYALRLLSHKIGRYLVPFFLLATLAASVLLALRDPAGLALLAPQLAIYGLGALGRLLRSTAVGRLRVLAVPYFFCFVNAAALVGVLSFAAGRRISAWTARGGEAALSSGTASPRRAREDDDTNRER